jgi:hypothetical protein
LNVFASPQETTASIDLTAQVLAFAILIGGIALPGAFLAKAFVERMLVHIHRDPRRGGDRRRRDDDFRGGARLALIASSSELAGIIAVSANRSSITAVGAGYRGRGGHP